MLGCMDSGEELWTTVFCENRLTNLNLIHKNSAKYGRNIDHDVSTWENLSVLQKWRMTDKR